MDFGAHPVWPFKGSSVSRVKIAISIFVHTKSLQTSRKCCHLKQYCQCLWWIVDLIILFLFFLKAPEPDDRLLGEKHVICIKKVSSLFVSEENLKLWYSCNVFYTRKFLIVFTVHKNLKMLFKGNSKAQKPSQRDNMLHLFFYQSSWFYSYHKFLWSS